MLTHLLLHSIILSTTVSRPLSYFYLICKAPPDWLSAVSLVRSTKQHQQPRLHRQSKKPLEPFPSPIYPSRHFHSADKMAADGLLKLMTERRSFYPLNKEIPVTPKRVMEIVKTAVHQTPSSFNSQSNRVLVLFGTDHEKLWDITAEDLRAVVPADLWDPTGKKITMSKAAAGTVRFLAFPLPPSF
jgi:hypothetical protein